MAIGDYILCCKCEVKLIYDGDRDQREWWEERFGKEPEIECPNCKPQRKPLNWEPIQEFWRNNSNIDWDDLESAIKQAAHGIKENT